jgi:alkylation response protein AidB-like acyl-CoA dehydrogenase
MPGTDVKYPPLATFTSEAGQFLAQRYPRRAAAENAAFQWGVGSDEINVFAEPDAVEEADALAQVRAWRAELWDAGYGWISGPVAYGGRGYPASYQRAFEQLTRSFEVPGDAALTISLGMIAPTILRRASEEQRRRWLPAMYRGDLVSCQLFSEPGAGSDLASIATQAVRTGDTWRITGQKVWTSGAHLADVGEIICRTSPSPRHHNLTAFIVGMHAPGVTVRPLRQMTGGAAFNEVFFDDVEVPDADRLGDVGAGWEVALTTLSHERNAMGNSSFGGIGLMSTDRLIELVRQAGAAHDPTVREAFGELMMELRAARYVTEVMAARARVGELPGAEAGLSKIALSANVARMAAFIARVLGPKAVADSGEWGTYAWTNLMLGAPGYRLGGGTDEVLKNSIAQRVLDLPRSS